MTSNVSCKFVRFEVEYWSVDELKSILPMDRSKIIHFKGFTHSMIPHSFIRDDVFAATADAEIFAFDGDEYSGEGSFTYMMLLTFFYRVFATQRPKETSVDPALWAFTIGEECMRKSSWQDLVLFYDGASKIEVVPPESLSLDGTTVSGEVPLSTLSLKVIPFTGYFGDDKYLELAKLGLSLTNSKRIISIGGGAHIQREYAYTAACAIENNIASTSVYTCMSTPLPVPPPVLWHCFAVPRVANRLCEDKVSAVGTETTAVNETQPLQIENCCLLSICTHLNIPLLLDLETVLEVELSTSLPLCMFCSLCRIYFHIPKFQVA